MGTTKILVVANAPGILHRLEETLAGLQLEVAIRLRDVARAVKRQDYALVVLCLGFNEHDTVRLLATLAGEPRPLRIVCVAPEDLPRPSLADLEARVRAAGAMDFIPLAEYPQGPNGILALRERILLSDGEAHARATAVSRTLERAAQISGGVTRLAAHLGVGEQDLLRWIQAREEPSEEVFLAAFDIVLSDLERGARKPS